MIHECNGQNVAILDCHSFNGCGLSGHYGSQNKNERLAALDYKYHRIYFIILRSRSWVSIDCLTQSYSFNCQRKNEMMEYQIELKGRSKSVTIPFKQGNTILELALEHAVDWGFSCSRGTCARCRCLILEGRDLLNEITDAEKARLEEDEIEAGYRLGCQAVPMQKGLIRAVNKTYF